MTYTVEGINYEDAPKFSVDESKRTITGLATQYGVTASYQGVNYQYQKGVWQDRDPSRVKLLIAHDWDRAVGHAVKFEETDDGLLATFKVARGAAGDEALSMAMDGVWDGLSVQAQITEWDEVDGVIVAKSALLRETSLTPQPAFDGSRVQSVAASGTSNTKEEITMTDKVTDTTESVDVSASIKDAIMAGFESLKADGPELVAPVVRAEVTEAPLYRFDGVKASHDFSTDLIAGLKDNDGEAMNRVQTFLAEAFSPKANIDTSTTAVLNPARQRPDMYVDERKYATPFYSAMYKGTLSDITPFVFPKFVSATNLVNPHVEGVEPSLGDAEFTTQTVTPSAVSGKVQLTREVWDQGGSPQVSTVIFQKMTYAYYQALEAKAVALLGAASPEQIALTAGATDADLVDELEAELAELNFIAGGNIFTFAGTQVDLYKALVGASDSTGRKLLPIIGATNANGQARGGFKSVDVAGTTFTPAWSLGASGAGTSSYLVDADSVHVWNSPPQKLEFQYRVAHVDLAIWGYVAAAISDLTGVREISYDATV